MSKLEQKAFESANKAFGLIEDMTWDMDKEFHNYHQEAFKQGYALCQKEYEEKLRWIPIYEPPKTAELVIVDSGENLHACVAVAFFEDGFWKYANGQKLWFVPRRWRRFL